MQCKKNEVSHKGLLQYVRPNPQFPADMVTFTQEIFNENFILFAVMSVSPMLVTMTF